MFSNGADFDRLAGITGNSESRSYCDHLVQIDALQ